MKRIFTLCAVLLVAVTAMAQEGAKVYGIKSGTYKTEMDKLTHNIAALSKVYGNMLAALGVNTNK